MSIAAASQSHPASNLRHDDDVLGKAIASAKAGRFSDAEHLFNALLLRRPTDPRAPYNFGILLAQVGRHEEAERRIRQAIGLGLRSPRIFYNQEPF